MATALAELHSYWSATPSLTAYIPPGQVYTGLVPESLLFPYAVIVPLRSLPTWTCSHPYHEAFGFQIHVYSDDDAGLETMVGVIKDAFDHATIATTTISCERRDYLFTVEPAGTFHATLEYVHYRNRDLGRVDPPLTLYTATRSPTVGGNDTSFGAYAWTNTGNLGASDNANALVNLVWGIDGGNANSNYLTAKGFNFTVPAAATVQGIAVRIERSTPLAAPTIKDARLRLIKTGVIGTTDRADTATFWTGNNTEVTASYGGSTDTWGDTWTGADVDSANFGVAFAVNGSGAAGANDANVDHIQVTVYYLA